MSGRPTRLREVDLDRFFWIPDEVSGSGATLLTTVVSLDPIYCYADADERAILKYIQLSREGKRESARYKEIPVEMELANETGFPHKGYVDFLDNRIDPTTGTMRGRGVKATDDIQESFERWQLWWLLGLNDIRQRYRRSRLGQTWITLSLLATGCAPDKPAPAPSTDTTVPAAGAPAGKKPWPEFVAAFIEERFKADPYFAVGAGRFAFSSRSGRCRAVADVGRCEGRSGDAEVQAIGSPFRDRGVRCDHSRDSSRQRTLARLGPR